MRAVANKRNWGKRGTLTPVHTITHWKPIILPEQALKKGDDEKKTLDIILAYC